MSRSLKAHILLILVTFVWGVTFVQIKDALRQSALDIAPPGHDYETGYGMLRVP